MPIAHIIMSEPITAVCYQHDLSRNSDKGDEGDRFDHYRSDRIDLRCPC